MKKASTTDLGTFATFPTFERARFNLDVRAERSRQVAKGYTAQHDAEHGIEHVLRWAY